MGPEDFFISRLAHLATKVPGPFPIMQLGEQGVYHDVMKSPVSVRSLFPMALFPPLLGGGCWLLVDHVDYFGFILDRMQVYDTAAGIVASIKDPEAVGNTYEFVGPKEYSMKQLIEFIATAIRLPINTVSLPAEITPVVMLATKLVGMSRLTILPCAEEYYTYGHSDIRNRKMPGLVGGTIIKLCAFVFLFRCSCILPGRHCFLLRCDQISHS
jgi:hypothetical protein